ncbi:uncharacterized protein [Nicotiana tomentosiformis]|uniref:uncharacterized protein n=1 Tax=Nicotiana tomentosiformis TaxID=4098 RepID=UPI00388C5FF3
MAKTSKTMPQKEKASSSRPSGDKAPVEPSTYDYIPGPCVTKDAALRPSSGEEGTKSPVPKSGKNKKSKAASRSEGPIRKTRWVRRKAISLLIDSVQRLREEEEEEEEEEEGGALALVTRSARVIEVTEAPEPMAACEVELQKVSGERDALRLLCSQKDEAIKDLQADLAKAREEEAELDKQVSLVLLKYGFDSTVEVNPSLSQLQQKAKKIGSLREEVDQIKAEYNRWKETIDHLAVEKETILTNLLSADVQLQNVKKKGSAQAKWIEELEAQLAEAKAEVESSKILADNSVAVYRAAQMEVREAAETADTRAHWIAKLAKCRSRRETIGEIHARGFDLTEEIKKAKELKVEAGALASDSDDDDDDCSKSRSEDGGEPDREANAPEDDQEA